MKDIKGLGKLFFERAEGDNPERFALEIQPFQNFLGDESRKSCWRIHLLSQLTYFAIKEDRAEFFRAFDTRSSLTRRKFDNIFIGDFVVNVENTEEMFVCDGGNATLAPDGCKRIGAVDLHEIVTPVMLNGLLRLGQELPNTTCHWVFGSQEGRLDFPPTLYLSFTDISIGDDDDGCEKLFKVLSAIYC